MTLMELARAAVLRRLARIELAARDVPGIEVERRGDLVTVRMARWRWLQDMRLRFLGRER